MSAKAGDLKAPVCVTGVMLRGDGIGAECDMVVSVEIGGLWVDVIRERNSDTISHIVEPLGIRNAQLAS
jgi:hypothetical protein